MVTPFAARFRIALLSITAALSACADYAHPLYSISPDTGVIDLGELAPSVTGDWWIVRIAGQPPVEGTRPTLSFAPSTKSEATARMNGDTGCNTLMGSYTYDHQPKTITIRDVSATRMACPAAVMRQETLILDHLQDTTRAMQLQPGSLVLYTAEGRVLWLQKRVAP